VVKSVEEGYVLRGLVRHAIAYCTNAWRGLSATSELLVFDVQVVNNWYEVGVSIKSVFQMFEATTAH